MGTETDYFEKTRPKPVWLIGDRVFGRWNDIPFIGTVAVDHVVSEIEGPRVSIFLDLPVFFEDAWHRMVTLKQDQLTRLKPLVEEKAKKLKTTKPKKSST